MFDLTTIFYLIMLGSFVGIVSGLFGIGGGGIIVPVLTSILLMNDFPIDNVVHIALGTSMATIIVTSFSSFRSHHKKGAVRWDIVKLMIPGIILGTFLATFVASNLNSFVLSICFSVFMAYSALVMFFNKKPKSEKKVFSAPKQVLAGSVIGSLSSLVSIGGGILTVPYLIWQSIDIKKAIGTSSAVGFPIAIAGTIGYIINGWEYTSYDNLMIGFVNLPSLLFIATFSYLTAPIGVSLAHKLPLDILKKLFSLLPLALSIKLLLTFIN